MTIEELREAQTPLKERYRSNPDAALITLTAEGRIGEHVTRNIGTAKGDIEAGLHPATSGPTPTLRKLTERNSVVFQTLRQPPAVELSIKSSVLS